jgi:hypothetical protein
MMLVPTWPGSTRAARTWGALVRRSSISASVNPRTANLAVLYAVCGTPGPSEAHNPFMLLVLTSTPSPLAISRGKNARAQ